MSNNNSGDDWGGNSDNWDNSNAGDDWGDGASGGNEFSETAHRSWLQRIGDSIKGILFGLVLVIGAGALLFWNEGRAAKTAAALNEGAGIVQSVANDKLEAGNNGKLVHVSGDTSASGQATDPDLGFAAKGLRLSRAVEMYQWKEDKRTETRQKLGGGEERVTTYRYVKEWSNKAIDSSRFRRQSGHQNPAWPSTGSRSFAATGAKLGAFSIDTNVISRLGDGERIDIPQTLQQNVQRRFGDKAQIRSGDIYVGYNPDAPQVGDLRITYKLLPLQTVSVVGRQTGGGFSPYTARNGRQLLLASTGARDASAMFQSAQDENTLITWGLRVLGVFLMFAGFSMVLAPIAVFASVIPVLGDIAGFGTGLIAMIATAITAPVIIAIAWLFYRPLLSVIVLAIGAALVFGLKYLGRQRAARLQAQHG